MYRYKQILVAMNSDERDEAILREAAKISRMAESELVYFIHAVSLDIPPNILDEYPAMLKMIEEDAKEKMKNLINKHFKDYSDAVIEYEVIQGDPVTEILRKVRQRNIDLVVTGEDSREDIRRKLPEKLIRKSPCSVLSVPQTTRAIITKILAPLDFSGHSDDTLEIAITFARAVHLEEVHVLHAYNVPRGFHSIGKSREEFAQIMKENAEKDFKKFMSGRDTRGIKVKPTFVLDEHPGNAITEFIREEAADFLVIGARGRTNSAAILLGSVAEHLIHHANIPLLAVKRKGEKLNFLDALFEA